MASSIATTTSVTVLRKGDYGPEVTDLQYLLINARQIDPSIVGPADGDFGSKTQAAVRLLQRRNNLLQDGIVGPITWKAVAPVNEWPTRTAGAFMRKGDQRAESLQSALQSKGFYYGAIDGDFGPMTHSAVVNFQRTKQDTNIKGVVGPYTFGALMSVLSLSLDGVQFIDTQTTRTSGIPFGTDAEFVRSVLTKHFSASPDVFRNDECPGGPLTVMTWPNGFAINADSNQKFVGWSVRQGTESAGYATMDGIRIGMSRRELEQDTTARIFESTLGTEFNIGQLSGILTSDRDNATVESLWAGTNCIFR